MNNVLRDYLRKFVAVYLDDIIIFSKDKKSHKRHVKKVLKKIRDANLKVKITKCQWFLNEIKFVKHKVNQHRIQPDENNMKKIRKFLEMAQYYRTFIKGFADIARPLTI